MTRNAKLLTPNAKAGKLWWETYLGSRWPDVQRRFREAKTVYWEPASEMPVDLFAFVREAALCFSVARFLATLFLSGALVEIVLNRDTRLSSRTDLRRINDWITLNNTNLIAGRSAGLPVNDLLDPDEVLEPHGQVRFVRARNKVAHEDVGAYPVDLPEQSSEWEREALDQLQKATTFLVSWFNSQ